MPQSYVYNGTTYGGDGYKPATSEQLKKMTYEQRLEEERNSRATRGLDANLSPDWTNSLRTEMALDQVNPNQTSGGFSGVDYNYLGNLLKGQIDNGMPQMGMYRQNSQAAVNTGADQAKRTLQANLAGSGMLRSGMATTGLMNVEGQREQALADNEVKLSGMDQTFRSQALGNLLGLNQLGLRELEGNRNYSMGLQNSLINQDQMAWERTYKNDNTPSPWGNVLGQLISSGAQVGAAAASDRRLKDNINKVGVSPSGINIYEFNYKWSPKRFRGVLADEVPQASIDINGIKFVDYSKIDVNFEAI